jgi:predicted  nucleic acid-binding Zn-ribbon protein
MKKTFATPLIPISWGELVDKITILEIKQINIKSLNALSNINKEHSYLNEIIENQTDLAELIKDLKIQLLDINKRLWQVEDDVRDKELRQEFDAKFIELARSVYRLNDERAKLKKTINQTLNSELVEEKSYKDFQIN